MRRILVDEARRRQRLKRGGGGVAIGLDPELMGVGHGSALDLIDLDEALEELGAYDEQQTRIVELRFFGGLRMQDVASVLSVSLSTVEREWRCARAWLGARLRSGPGT